MGLLKLSGSLIGGPSDSAAGQFPSSSFAALVGFGVGDSKPSSVATGVLARTLPDLTSNAFVVLEGVGPTSGVTQGNFLYFKCNSNMTLRITQDDGAGGDQVSLLSVNGLAMVEATETGFIKKLECKGSGPLEYLVSGNQ